MNIRKKIFLFALLINIACEKSSDDLKLAECVEYGIPPFDGTIFIDPDIITPDDPTTFTSLNYSGKDNRTMYDRRNGGGWLDLEPYLFRSLYNDQLEIEIQVNPEFDSIENAKEQAEKFAPIIGRLTTELRKDVKTVWIHKGLEPFGGGNNNLLIHTDWSAKYYEKQGILEETFVHEASHTSLDSYHAQNTEWLIAQKADCNFISTYAKENPAREDIAESYLTYFAIRYRSDRISKELKQKIEQTIPNRIKYFDDQKFNIYPLQNNLK